MSHQPRKRFGQHFLRDTHVLDQLQHFIHPESHQHLVEIGPGEGVMTERLAPYVQRLDVIEIDRDLAAGLSRRWPKIFVHTCDVLRFDFTSLGENLRVVGNLPYNISSPLLFHLFQYLDRIEDMHFMLQKEVVLRMTAEVGDKNYNRLSVMTQYFCDNEFLFEVKPEAFFPPPKVDSAVVAMRPRTTRLKAENMDLFGKIVQTAFNFRRKTLHNCLKGIATDEQLRQSGLNPGQRPQELTVDDFVNLSNLLYHSQRE